MDNKENGKQAQGADAVSPSPEGPAFLEAFAQIQANAERQPKPEQPQTRAAAPLPHPPAGWD